MGNYSKDNFFFPPAGSPIKPKSKRVKKTTSKNNDTQPSNLGDQAWHRRSQRKKNEGTQQHYEIMRYM